MVLNIQNLKHHCYMRSLVAGVLPGAIWNANFKTHLGLGSGYLKDCLLLAIFTHQIQSNRLGMLWVLSAKEHWLAGTRRWAFSAVAPTLWNIVPSEIRMTLTLLVPHSMWRLGYVAESRILTVLRTQFLGCVSIHDNNFTQQPFIYPDIQSGERGSKEEDYFYSNST